MVPTTASATRVPSLHVQGGFRGASPLGSAKSKAVEEWGWDAVLGGPRSPQETQPCRCVLELEPFSSLPLPERRHRWLSMQGAAKQRLLLLPEGRLLSRSPASLNTHLWS